MDTTNFEAMVATAASKYTKLVNTMYEGADVNDDKFIKNMNLIHSIYQDEMALIARLYENEYCKKNEKKIELKVFDFMVKR